MRILYIHHNGIPPVSDPVRDRFQGMDLECVMLRPIWVADAGEVEKLYGPGSYPVHTIGKTQYHWFVGLPGQGGLKRKFKALWFYVGNGFRLYKERRYDCIVTYSHMMTGVCGAILKMLTGAGLVVEVITVPDRSYLVLRPKPRISERLLQRFSDLCLHISLLSADVTHLIGPKLIEPYAWLRKIRTAIFPEFVPISLVPPKKQSEEEYILFVGSPWYLKGVDVLVKAFSKVAPEFPTVKLKLVGWFYDREPLDKLIQQTPGQIEVLNPMPNPQVLEAMSRAEIFVLPSRCEGMGCVILEAMASGVPIVATDMGGIPMLVRDGENGFLVPVDEVAALEDRLRTLLRDKALRERMGARSYELAHGECDEESYRRKFVQMVREAVELRRTKAST